MPQCGEDSERAKSLRTDQKVAGQSASLCLFANSASQMEPSGATDPASGALSWMTRLPSDIRVPSLLIVHDETGKRLAGRTRCEDGSCGVRKVRVQSATVR
jgi:hypothetical protein